jgi:hypothetical protein
MPRLLPGIHIFLWRRLEKKDVDFTRSFRRDQSLKTKQKLNHSREDSG